MYNFLIALINLTGENRKLKKFTRLDRWWLANRNLGADFLSGEIIISGETESIGYRCGWPEGARVHLCYVTRKEEREEKLERPRRNRVLSSPSSLNRAPRTSSSLVSHVWSLLVKHATGELSKEKARRQQLSLRWNTRRLVDQVRTRECPMSSIRGRIEVSLYTPLLLSRVIPIVDHDDESIS